MIAMFRAQGVISPQLYICLKGKTVDLTSSNIVTGILYTSRTLEEEHIKQLAQTTAVIWQTSINLSGS